MAPFLIVCFISFLPFPNAHTLPAFFTEWFFTQLIHICTMFLKQLCRGKAILLLSCFLSLEDWKNNFPLHVYAWIHTTASEIHIYTNISKQNIYKREKYGLSVSGLMFHNRQLLCASLPMLRDWKTTTTTTTTTTRITNLICLTVSLYFSIN